MAEGDSIWRLARRMDAHLAGGRVARSDIRVPRFATAELTGRQVLGTDTRGKHLLTRLSGGLTLHSHLRMSGSWVLLRAGRRLPRTATERMRLGFRLESGVGAAALDMPVLDLVATEHEATLVGHLGPDPLRDDWDEDAAVARLRRRPALAVKAALLDQRLVCGLGNLWANELCFLRGVYPGTALERVDIPPLVRLAARALRHSARSPGAYQVTTGDPRRDRRHWVIGRAGRPCLRCGTRIDARERDPVLGDRRTWWCPNCQPATE